MMLKTTASRRRDPSLGSRQGATTVVSRQSPPIAATMSGGDSDSEDYLNDSTRPGYGFETESDDSGNPQVGLSIAHH